MIDVRTEQVLVAELDRAVADSGALGVTAAVQCDGLGAWAGSSGSLDFARNAPIGPDARMPAYSITKTFTAVCVLRLAELGALSLEDPISKWITGLSFGDAVSVRALLNQTAGVPNYSGVEDQIRALAATPLKAWSFDEFVAATCNSGLDFEPGQDWSYSNTGYMLLKRVVERASGAGYADAVALHIVRPMGFSATGVVGDSLADLAPGYSRRFSADGEPADVRRAYDPGWCATGLVASTAAELSAFYYALFGGKLVTRASLAQMLELVRVPGDFPPVVTPSYGLGLMADPDSPFGPEFGHGGAGPGFDVRASCWPQMKERRVAIVVMCNTDEIESVAISARLAAALANQLGETFTLS